MKTRRNLGGTVRAQRKHRQMTQVELARRLEISPSYLNLIEHNERPLTASLLLKLAAEFDLKISDFQDDTSAQLADDLAEVFADPIFETQAMSDDEVRGLVEASPAGARAILSLYHNVRATRASLEDLSSRIYDGEQLPSVASRLPSEEVNDFIQRHMNHFPELEEGAERLWREAKLEIGARYRGMVRYLEERDIEVAIRGPAELRGALRRYDPERGCLSLSEALPAHGRNFQLALQIGLLTQGDFLERMTEEAGFSSDASLIQCRVVLAAYFAGAVLMPYDAFLDAARSDRYDIELVGHRFSASFEQVCHRLTSLRRPGNEGIPFHLLRVDLAGNISKQFSATGIRFARFAGTCPRWNVFSAFQTPNMIRTQISAMPDGTKYFCVARTIPKGRGGYHALHSVQAIGLGCQLAHARELVYTEGIDLTNLEKIVPVGVTCRLCERTDCEERVFPSIRTPGRMDENVRGISVYTPVDD